MQTNEEFDFRVTKPIFVKANAKSAPGKYLKGHSKSTLGKPELTNSSNSSSLMRLKMENYDLNFIFLQDQ